MIEGFDYELASRGAEGADRETADKALLVEFMAEPVQVAGKEENGVPFFEDRDFIRITTPGVRPTVFYGEVTEVHKKRFPRDWAVYQSKGEKKIAGFPLKEWSLLPATIYKRFEFLNVLTVEQLSAIPDAVASKLGQEGFNWRDKAKVFLENAKAQAPFQVMKEENETLKKELDLLREEVKKIQKKADKKDN